MNQLNFIFDYFILYPLRKLYFFGPSFYGYGFWSGKDFPEICSELSLVKINSFQCNDLLEKKFQSFVILIQISIYFFILYYFVQNLWKSLCYFVQFIFKYSLFYFEKRELKNIEFRVKKNKNRNKKKYIENIQTIGYPIFAKQISKDKKKDYRPIKNESF